MTDAKRANKQVSLIAAYHNVFSSTDGVRVLHDLMRNHHILSNTFSGDVNEMLVREGERNVVLRIFSLMKMDVQKLKERIDEYARENE